MQQERWISDGPVSRRWPIFTRGNIGEVFPEAISPLGWDLGGYQAELGFRDAYLRLGMISNRDLKGEHDFVILGVFNAYCYLNVSLMRMLAVRAPGATVEELDVNLFGAAAAPPYTPCPGDRDLICSIKLIVSVLRILSAKSAPEMSEANRLVDGLLDRCPNLTAGEGELLQYLDLFSMDFRRLMDLHISASFCALTVAGIITKICTEAGDPSLQVDIMGGIVGDDLASAQPSHAMWSLSRLARSTPEVESAFDQGVDGLVDRFADMPEAEEFCSRFADFLAKFGHRGPNEWEITARTCESHPEIALNAVDPMRIADDDRDPSLVAAKSRERAKLAVAGLEARLKPRQRKQLQKALRSIAIYQAARESTKSDNVRALNAARRVFVELAGRAAERGGSPNPRDAAMLNLNEFQAYLRDPPAYRATITERLARHKEFQARVPPFVIDSEVPPFEQWARRKTTPAGGGPKSELSGSGGAPGVARGKARIVLDPADPRGLQPGEILVAPITDPAWTPLFVPAGAVVIEVGAMLSHAVIVARELGIPCACSVNGATTVIPDGAIIEVDGSKGTVRLLDG